jgi:hypothetical protein
MAAEGQAGVVAKAMGMAVRSAMKTDALRLAPVIVEGTVLNAAATTTGAMKTATRTDALPVKVKMTGTTDIKAGLTEVPAAIIMAKTTT